MNTIKAHGAGVIAGLALALALWSVVTLHREQRYRQLNEAKAVQACEAFHSAYRCFQLFMLPESDYKFGVNPGAH